LVFALGARLVLAGAFEIDDVCHAQLLNLPMPRGASMR
jgi:hypothetical protein